MPINTFNLNKQTWSLTIRTSHRMILRLVILSLLAIRRRFELDRCESCCTASTPFRASVLENLVAFVRVSVSSLWAAKDDRLVSLKFYDWGKK